MEFLDKYFDTAFAAPNGVKRLRELILSLAMRGKLVRQDPGDKPASELLKEIEAEKERLVKEGKIKRSNKLPEIKVDEVPYELPETWEWVRLGAIVSILGDGLHGSPNYDDTGEYFFINGNNLSDGVIKIKEDTKSVAIGEYIKYRKELNKNTVLVSINGTIGNVAFYNNEKVVLGKSSCYFNLLLNVNKCYIKRLINSPYFLQYALASATGSTIKNVSLKVMREFIVPLPPCEEQCRIVEKIDILMSQCDRLEALQKERNQKRLIVHTAACDRLLNSPDKNSFSDAWEFIRNNFSELYSVKENLSELRKAILQLAVMGKLVPQEPSDESALILFKKIRQQANQLVCQKKEKRVNFEEISNQDIFFFLPKSWLWVKLGSLLKSLKYGTSKKKYLTYAGYLIRLRSFPECICSRYLYFALNTTFVRTQIEKPLRTTSGVKNINSKEIANLLIPLPPLPEQHRIVAKVDRLMELCDRLEQQIDKATDKQTALLNAIMAKI